MKYTFTVAAKSEVDFADIAGSFADRTSVEQTAFLDEIFDGLKFECKNHFAYESQLLYIAKEIKLKNFKNLIYVIETLNEFLKCEENG